MQLLPNDWNRVREHYRRFTPEIMAERKNEWGIDPYSWDEGAGMIHMTPIESWLWADIRAHDLVLYPQYPVGRYFVDFGNPRARVAIECDGAAYHRDQQRDAARQADIEALNWTVYRFPGWMCRTDSDEETGEPGEAGRLIKAIGITHGIVREATPSLEDWTSFGALAMDWLNRHGRTC